MSAKLTVTSVGGAHVTTSRQVVVLPFCAEHPSGIHTASYAIASQPPLAGVPEQQADLDQLQASQRFASAPCRRAIAEAYELWHRSTSRRARLQSAQEVLRANVSGRLVWYIRNQSEDARHRH